MQVQLAFLLVGLSAVVSGSQTSGSAGFGPPENVRIALASEGALSFSWSTAVEGLGGLGNYTPECRASTTKGGPYTLVSRNGSSSAYLPEISYHHHVIVASLHKGTTYYYRCGDWGGTPASPTLSSPAARVAEKGVATSKTGADDAARALRSARQAIGTGSPATRRRATEQLQQHHGLQQSHGVAGTTNNGIAPPSLTSERRLHRPAPRADGGMRAIIFGDLGNNNSGGTITQILSQLSAASDDKQPDFIFHTGDISYADDLTTVGTNPRYEAAYDQFMARIEPLSSSVPYQVNPGNHDVSCHAVWDEGCDKRMLNFSAYRSRWAMPWQQSNAVGSQGLWYSFTMGSVHMVAIDTESDYKGAPIMGASFKVPGPFGDQMGWLEKDLAAASASEAVKWIIVLGHRPWLTSASKPDWPPDQRKKVNAWLEPLFQRYSVDVYIAAHVHAYERSYPIRNNNVVQQNFSNVRNGTVHIVHGAAGNMEGHQKLKTPEKRAPFSVVANDVDYGHAVLEVVNSTRLEWRFFRGSDGAEVDNFTLTKGEGGPNY